MVKISIQYEGELHCVVRHGPSEATLTTDAPVDNHGKGESFSPTDLVATAFGVCMATVMGIKANQKGIAIEGATVEVEKVMTSDLPRRIASLKTTFRVPHAIVGADREILEATALGCPVARSVHPDIEKPVEFVWGENR